MRTQNWEVEKRFIKVSDCVTAEWVLMARIKLKCKCWPTPAKLGVAERNLDFYLSSGGFLIWDTNYFLRSSNCSIWCASSFEDMQRNEGSKVRRKCPRKVVQLKSSRLQSFYRVPQVISLRGNANPVPAVLEVVCCLHYISGPHSGKP